MKHILFVDDELNVLDGLRRMLRGMRHEWDMVFAQSGDEALKLLSEAPFDVVVTDMRMPGMSGAELLQEIRDQYPHIVRIVLSGQLAQEMLLRSVELTHQFIAKPCDADLLKNVVTRSLALHNLLQDETLKQLVSGMKSLPSLPSLYVEIMDELKSPSSSMARVGGIISKDIGMTAKVLQLVNSAFFGLPKHVHNPSQAAILLGIDTIRSLVLSVNIFSQFAEECLKGQWLDQLWKHSLTTSVLAKEIFRKESRDQKAIDHVFMAGLLHDVGKIILAVNLPEKYGKVFALADEEGINLVEAEEQALNVNHADVGAYLLGIWGLPDSIVEAICFHHSPLRCPNLEFSPLTAVHVANALEAEQDDGNIIGRASQVDLEYLDKIGLGERLAEWRDIHRNIDS